MRAGSKKRNFSYKIYFYLYFSDLNRNKKAHSNNSMAKNAKVIPRSPIDYLIPT